MENFDNIPSNSSESRVDTIYIYRRLWDALDGENLALDVSNLFTELAHNFYADTGVKAGPASQWEKFRSQTDDRKEVS